MLRSLVNLNPIAEMQQFADMMDRAFGEWRENENQRPTLPDRWTLPVDIYEREGKLVVKAPVAGMKPEDVDVSIENNVLTISGESREETEQNDKVYRREYRYGAFTRSIRLPEDIDTQGVEAKFDNGFVKITLPRHTPEKPKATKIPVQAGNEETKTIEAKSKPENAKNGSK